MEVELFGIEQSNGEQARKAGALEEAHGGTLFIDEIGDLPGETQNKILRVLVDQTFMRVAGGTTKVNVDVRIISSTARNLEEEIAEGRFREDLYHRLSVVPIRVPPLSEHREDIPELIEYFMEQISHRDAACRSGRSARMPWRSRSPMSGRAISASLRNNVERVMILAGGGSEVIITADMLPQDVGSMVPSMPTSNNGEHIMGLPLREAREVFERDYLIAQISRFSGNISRTAEFVGMERSAFAPQASRRSVSAKSLISTSASTQASERTCRASPMCIGQYVNLREAAVNVEDRGYQFADGIYEVCEIIGGKMVDFPRHMPRACRDHWRESAHWPRPCRWTSLKVGRRSRTPSALSLRCKGGALHADVFSGARDITRKAADLRNQIIAFEHFAGFAVRRAHDVLAIVAGRHRRHHRADVLRQHVGGDDHLRPAAGQDHDAFDVVAKLADVARLEMGPQDRHGVLADLPLRKARGDGDLLHEIFDELRISSRCSDSGGTRIGTTERR